MFYTCGAYYFKDLIKSLSKIKKPKQILIISYKNCVKTI